MTGLIIDIICLAFIYVGVCFFVCVSEIYKLYPNMCSDNDDNYTKIELLVICVLSFNIVSVLLFVVGVVTGKWISIDTSILLQNLSAINNFNLFFLSSSTISTIALKLVDKRIA